MAEVAFSNPALKSTPIGSGLPAALMNHMGSLLALDDREAAFAAVIASHRLSWLYSRDAIFEGLLSGSRAPERSLLNRLKLDLFGLAETGEEQRNAVSRLAGFVLVYWGQSIAGADKLPLVSSIELRELLIHASETYRLATLDHLLRFSRKDEEWQTRIACFLKDIWPRQSRVRTPEASGRLAGLALAAPLNQFPAVVSHMTRALKPVGLTLYRLDSTQCDGAIHAREHPAAMLELLCSVLLDDTLLWSTGVQTWLEELARQPATADNDRLLHLLRKAAYR